MLGAAALLAVVLVLYLVFSKAPEPEGPGLLAQLRERLRPQTKGPAKAPEPARPAESPRLTQVPKAAPKAPAKLVAGRTWRYDVVVEPALWRDISLTYRTRSEAGGVGVLTDFVHAEGKMNFYLGHYAAGHASHANTRFPGFFMYASYFPAELKPGQRLAWSWAWQPQRDGRLKRYEGQVLRWEKVEVPAGTFDAALIAAELAYVEGGQVRAMAKESLWYAPAVAQVVRVVREGRTPDEGATRIVAELAEYR